MLTLFNYWKSWLKNNYWIINLFVYLFVAFEMLHASQVIDTGNKSKTYDIYTGYHSGVKS